MSSSSLRTLIRYVKPTGSQPLSRFLISLLVKPGVSSNREGISAISSSHVSINVSTRAENGAANKSVEVLLARTLNLPKSHVRLVKGLTSREKTAEVSISTMGSPEEKVEWLKGMLEGSIKSSKNGDNEDKV